MGSREGMGCPPEYEVNGALPVPESNPESPEGSNLMTNETELEPTEPTPDRVKSDSELSPQPEQKEPFPNTPLARAEISPELEPSKVEQPPKDLSADQAVSTTDDLEWEALSVKGGTIQEQVQRQAATEKNAQQTKQDDWEQRKQDAAKLLGSDRLAELEVEGDIEAEEADWEQREQEAAKLLIEEEQRVFESEEEAENLLGDEGLEKIRKEIAEIEDEREADKLMENMDELLAAATTINAETGESIVEDATSKTTEKAKADSTKSKPKTIGSSFPSGLGMESGGYTVSPGRKPGSYDVKPTKPGALRKFLGTLWTETKGVVSDITNTFK
ncbi:hypothetical protein KKF05_01475 [Patescibacteria group bacterium]|nr:hypothetical protein [Patescibacteria group bacterium]